MNSVSRNLSVRAEWRSGWRVVLAASVGIATSIGLFSYCAGLFILPMQQEFGLSRGAASLAPIAGIGSALLAPFAGILIDRLGSRRIALAGMVLLAVIYLLLSILPSSPVLLYALIPLLAIAGVMTSAAVFTRSVATWFSVGPGLAFALTMTGLTIVAAAGMPVLANVIGEYGWREGYRALAALVLLFGLPISIFWLRERNARPSVEAIEPNAIDVPFGAAIRQWRYWFCIGGFTAAALPIGGFLSQLQPLLAGHDFSATAAALAGSVFAISIGTGRLFAGVGLDRLAPNWVAAGALLLPALGALLLLYALATPSSQGIAFVAIFMIGLGQGAETDFLSFFTLRLFGLRAFATIQGTFAMTVGLGIAAGGLMFARVYDDTGGYGHAIQLGAALYAVAALLMVFVKIPGRKSIG